MSTPEQKARLRRKYHRAMKSPKYRARVNASRRARYRAKALGR